MGEALAVVVAFLLGSIPFGLLLVRLTHGVDVRSVGSGNIGATNVARAAGAKTGVIVLLLDFLKGVAGVLAGSALAGPDPAAWLPGAVAFAPIAGHVFTPWLRFRGGKGVATALGVLVATDWRLAVAALAGFLVACVPTRMVSAGSLAGSLTAALVAFAWPRAGAPASLAWGIAAAALLILWRHRENVRRIAAGTENRLGRR